MNNTLHSLKSEIITHLLAVEQSQIGTARRQAEGIAIGSEKYYQLFLPLYEEDPALFSAAICVLRNPDDGIYVDFAAEFAKLYHYDPRRIAVHCIRLSLYFQIDTAACPSLLKGILQYAMDLQKSGAFEQFDYGVRLYSAAFELLKAAVSDKDKPYLQSTHSGASVRELFLDFLTLDEVVDSCTALLYELCHRHKAVAKCPAYIRKVVKALGIYDRLYGIGWQMYVGHKSSKTVEDGINLLEEIGFTALADLMRQVAAYKAAHPAAKRYPDRLAKEITALVTPEYCEQTISAYIAACKIEIAGCKG